MNIQLKTVFGDLIFDGDFSCLADCVKAAIGAKKSLSYADLSSADLSSADLSSANLSSADLSYADLSSADLSSADLSSANLSSANLSSADLSSADLSSADLSSANLSSADLSSAVHAYAQVSFLGHGECGRPLTAITINEGDPITIYCGCFTGTVDELEKYIANGDKKYRKTRTLAKDTVLALLEAKNESQ